MENLPQNICEYTDIFYSVGYTASDMFVWRFKKDYQKFITIVCCVVYNDMHTHTRARSSYSYIRRFISILFSLLFGALFSLGLCMSYFVQPVLLCVSSYFLSINQEID